MPRVLLVAATTGYQTRVFAEAARHLGFDLMLATDRCHVLEDPWGDRAIPVRFDDPRASGAGPGHRRRGRVGHVVLAAFCALERGLVWRACRGIR